MDVIYGLLLLGQGAAAAILLSRLGSAPRRIVPLAPVLDSPSLPVSVVIPTLNEAQRLPCVWRGCGSNRYPKLWWWTAVRPMAPQNMSRVWLPPLPHPAAADGRSVSR
ncbi:MAG: hypothetical protein HC918_11820, partial [Oscillatoriales cyanobacterium SM2_1_8]|nr:hypothetical protein [Oscillatoriales cyanobacterium SM2_1_8]